MPFLEPTNDLVFKQIFGREDRKEILIHFLNHILGKKKGHEIEDVAIMDPHQAPRIMGSRRTIVDVKCRDQAGMRYIVEMQVVPERSFDKRVLYYVAQAYDRQLESGENYEDLKTVIFLGILDFEFTQNHNYISTHYIRDVETDEHVLQDFQFKFIELPKFNKKKDELKTITDQWVFFLKNAEHLHQVPKVIHEQAIRWAFEIVDRANWSSSELELYEEAAVARTAENMRLAYQYDKGKKIGLEEGIEKGMEKGMEKGRAEGLQEERNSTALKMLAKGLDESLICEVTGLSHRELNQFKQDAK